MCNGALDNKKGNTPLKSETITVAFGLKTDGDMEQLKPAICSNGGFELYHSERDLKAVMGKCIIDGLLFNSKTMLNFVVW